MMTKEKAQEIRDALQLEVSKTLKKFGYRQSPARFTYDPTTGDFKTRIVAVRQTTKDANIAPISNERAAIGRKFRIRTRCYEVIKEIESGRKFTLLAKRIPDGKRFKVTLKMVQEGAY